MRAVSSAAVLSVAERDWDFPGSSHIQGSGNLSDSQCSLDHNPGGGPLEVTPQRPMPMPHGPVAPPSGCLARPVRRYGTNLRSMMGDVVANQPPRRILRA